MKINRVLVVALIGCCALLGKSSLAADYNARESVSILRKVAPRMTLSQVEKILPRNAIYGWDGQTKLGNWTWQVRRFRGFSRGAKIEGVLIFANDRAKYIGLRPAKNEAERERLTKAATAWRASDIVHTATIFLGDERHVDTPAIINRDTKRFINRISALLGCPSSKDYEAPGGGPGDEGWTAEWKLSRRRTIYGAETRTLLDSVVRPALQLTFDYSQMYRE